MNTRSIASSMLTQVIKQGCSLTAVFSKLLEPNIGNRDLAFIKDSCFGVLRWYYFLRPIESTLLHKPLKSKDTEISCLILLGLYQLLKTQVKEYAVVSETVSACSDFKKVWASGLVNKVLRRFLSEKESILQNLPEEARYAHPEWLVRRIKASWPDEWKLILEENNQKPPLWLRINIKKNSKRQYCKLLRDNKVNFNDTRFVSNALELDPPIPKDAIPSFNQGCVSIQDLSSQFATSLLDLRKNHRVLDACGAPGGKSSHILEKDLSLSKLVILDISKKRFLKIKDNLIRLKLGFDKTQFVLSDASQINEWWDGIPFDRILLDAPCSATGVIRRHPDIKVLRKESDVYSLCQVQMNLLLALWKTLKKGGKLLYSTCSILQEENEFLISSFVDRQKDAKYEKIMLPIGISRGQGIQILPKEGDGFYYTLLYKNK